MGQLALGRAWWVEGVSQRAGFLASCFCWSSRGALFGIGCRGSRVINNFCVLNTRDGRTFPSVFSLEDGLQISTR